MKIKIIIKIKKIMKVIILKKVIITIIDKINQLK